MVVLELEADSLLGHLGFTSESLLLISSRWACCWGLAKNDDVSGGTIARAKLGVCTAECLAEVAAPWRERFPDCRPLEGCPEFETARWYSDGLDLVEIKGDVYLAGGSDIGLSVENAPIGLRKDAEPPKLSRGEAPIGGYAPEFEVSLPGEIERERRREWCEVIEVEFLGAVSSSLYRLLLVGGNEWSIEEDTLKTVACI